MKEVKALAVMTRPELEQALEQMNVTRRLQHKLLELQQERIAELGGHMLVLRETLSAMVSEEELQRHCNDPLCSECKLYRFARAIVAATEPKP